MNAKQYIAGLPAWDGVSRLGVAFDKDDLLAAEVPCPPPADFTGRLVAVAVRRPYCAQIELIAVDVCRLTAP